MVAAKIWLFGLTGRMGKEISSLLLKENSNAIFIGGSEQGTPVKKTCEGIISSNIIIDFSGLKGNQQLYDLVIQQQFTNKSVLIGSTGLDDSHKKNWKNLASNQKLKVLMAPNTSLGIYLTLQAALKISGICVQHGFDVEIEESHHKFKKDSPSGTAVYLAEQLAHETRLKPVYHRVGERGADELGVHATRGGGIFGEHSIRLIGDDEEINISHRAFSRSLFAKGALVLASWLIKQKAGFYTTKDVKIDELI